MTTRRQFLGAVGLACVGLRLPMQSVKVRNFPPGVMLTVNGTVDTPKRYQAKFLLKPVFMDADGQIKPLSFFRSGTFFRVTDDHIYRACRTNA